MVDLNSLPNEELEAIVNGSHPLVAQQSTQNSSNIDLNSLSNEELEAIVNGTSTRTKDWNIIDSAKNLGSGVVEGLTGMVGLAADLNPFQSPAQRFTNKIIAQSKGGSGIFPASEIISKEIEPYLAEKDPQYRYARTTGNIAAPVPIKGANTLRTLVSSIFGGFGAQAAEDLTGDTKIAPVVGAVASGSVPGILSDTASLIRSIFKGATKDEIKGSAALAFNELTNLKPEQIQQGLDKLPDDALKKFTTTAEVTDNAGAAQLEKTLTSKGEGAQLANNRALRREEVRNQFLDNMSDVDAVTKEGLGSSLVNKATEVKGELDNAAEAAWLKFPRNESINVVPEQFQLERIISGKQGGLPTGSKVQELVDQMMLPDGVLTSGALQDIRSDAARLLRDSTNLSGHEERLLAYIVGKNSGVDRAFNRELPTKAKAIWDKARNITSTTADTFARENPGGALLNDFLSPQNALSSAISKGDSATVKKFKEAIGNDPELIEASKRGFLDLIVRDANGNLTANNMKKFIASREGSIKELLGEDHLGTMNRILDDLRSESKVGLHAFQASKGNSVTAQRQTVAGAVSDVIAGAVIPGIGAGAQIADAIKRAANIKDTAGVEALLLEASLNPRMAIELAQSPTNKRILNVMERLSDGLSGAIKDGGTAAYKELSRTQENINDPGKKLPQEKSTEVNRSQPSVVNLSPENQKRNSEQSISDQLSNQGSYRLDGRDNQPQQQGATQLVPKKKDNEGVVSNRLSSSPDNTPTSSLLKTVFGPSKSIVDDMFGSGDVARSPEFDKRAIEVADNLGIDPEHLFKVIGFETGGTFDSKVKNAAGSGATGLLQFMPPTAKDLTKADTEKAAIRLLESLTPTEQLDYVEKYLKPFKGKIKSLEDLYMAVLWPAAVGKDSTYALFREGTKAFAQNKGLDINDDGIITKAEAASKVRSYEV